MLCLLGMAMLGLLRTPQRARPMLLGRLGIPERARQGNAGPARKTTAAPMQEYQQAQPLLGLLGIPQCARPMLGLLGIPHSTLGPWRAC